MKVISGKYYEEYNWQKYINFLSGATDKSSYTLSDRCVHSGITMARYAMYLAIEILTNKKII